MPAPVDPPKAIRVRDDPDHPDERFAELYASLPHPPDLEPWLGWARAARPPVLYLGIGVGRLGIPLWAAGVRLIGVDSHPGMLQRLAARLPQMPVHCSRIEDLALPERFDLVMVPSNILCTMGRLERAAALLAPGGRLAFELTNPYWLESDIHPGVRVLTFAHDRALIEVDYDPGTGQVYTQEAEVSLIWPEAVDVWLSAVGLRLERLFGSLDGDLASSPTFYVLGTSR
jgi:SAM-dependent methyltransferase